MATEKKSVLRYPRVLVSILVVTALIICHFIVPSSNNGLKWIFDSVVLAFLVILFCIYQQEKEAEEEKKKRGKNDSDEERRDDR